MYKKGFYTSLMVIALVLGCNLVIVAYEVEHKVQKELRNELYILAYESSKTLVTNKNILNGVMKYLEASDANNIIARFDKYVSSLTNTGYKLIFLTNEKDEVIALSEGSAYRRKSSYNLSHRQYLKDAKSEPHKPHLGKLIYSSISGLLTIPLAQAILGKNENYLGAVVISMPLTQFSETLFGSHIKLFDIELHPQEHKMDAAIYTDALISKSFILKAAFYKAFKEKVIVPYSGISDINIILSIGSQNISEMFWFEYLDRSLISCGLIGIILVFIIIVLVKVIEPILRAQEKFESYSERLHALVPGYLSYRPMVQIDALTNIENFANASSLVIDTLIKQNEMIESKNRQLSVLQKNFSLCIRSLHESSMCLSENIDDLILNNKTQNNRYSDLIKTLESIYNYSKNHEDHISSLKDSLSLAQEISTQPKRYLDVAGMIQTRFGGLYRSLTINRSSVLNNRIFHPGAMENALYHILSSLPKDNNTVIALDEGAVSGPVSIEIFYKSTDHSIDSDKLQLGLKQARLFALIDEGMIGLYKGEGVIIITIVYTEDEAFRAPRTTLQ